MQINPMMKGKLLIEIQRSCVFERILQFIIHDTIMAAYSAILKQGSFCQSFSRSFGVGLRESRLNSSSRIGKPEQMMPMQRKGLNYSLKSGMPEITASMKYGAGEFMRLSTPKMSIFFLGSSLSSLVIIQAIALIEIYDWIMALAQLNKIAKDLIKVLEEEITKKDWSSYGAYFSLFRLYKIKLMSVIRPKSVESAIDGSKISKNGYISSIIAFSQLPSSVVSGLEVEEMTIMPRRISFSKKRSIIQPQGRSTQDGKAKTSRYERLGEGMNESNVSATSSIRSKRQKQGQPFEELPLLKNKLLTSKVQALQSGIDLSIISEGKSQSKLITPQQNKTKAETERKSSEDKRKTTFQRWFDNKNARGAIQNDQFSFSVNEIGDMTINPALHSFYEQPLVSEAFIQRSYSFKEFLNKKEQPLLNDRGMNFEEKGSKRLVKLRSLSKEKSKNDIAKRIIHIQNILAIKGAVKPSNTKIIALASLSKPDPIQKQSLRHEQHQNKVTFDMSFSSSNKSIDPPHSNLLDTSMIIQIS